MTPIRLFLLDDHALFREGLLRLFAGDSQFEIVGAASEPVQALEALKRGGVDVLLLDYDLDGITAGSFMDSLRQIDFAGRIFLVTAGLPDRAALELIRAGAAGIFHKQRAAEDLRKSILEVHAGKALIEQHYLQKLVSSPAQNDPVKARLTDRERKILRYLIEGLANKEIGGQLNVSESAVKAALQQIFAKTGVRTRSQLVRVAIETYRNEI